MNTLTCTKPKKGSVKKRSNPDNIVWMGSRPSKEQVQRKMDFWRSEVVQRDPDCSRRGQSLADLTKENVARVWWRFSVKNPRGYRMPSADGALMEFNGYEIQLIQEIAAAALGIPIPPQSSPLLPPEGTFIPIPQGIESIHISESRCIPSVDGLYILGVEVYVVSGGKTYFTWSYAYGITEEAVRKMFYSNPGAFRIHRMN